MYTGCAHTCTLGTHTHVHWVHTHMYTGCTHTCTLGTHTCTLGAHTHVHWVHTHTCTLGAHTHMYTGCTHMYTGCTHTCTHVHWVHTHMYTFLCTTKLSKARQVWLLLLPHKIENGFAVFIICCATNRNVCLRSIGRLRISTTFSPFQVWHVKMTIIQLSAQPMHTSQLVDMYYGQDKQCGSGEESANSESESGNGRGSVLFT